jgi:hypothetical protein
MGLAQSKCINVLLVYIHRRLLPVLKQHVYFLTIPVFYVQKTSSANALLSFMIFFETWPLKVVGELLLGYGRYDHVFLAIGLLEYRLLYL